jgi:sugar/nucleoside kinase (ribokinase family)
LHPNVALDSARRGGAPTTRKVRFIDLSYGRKLFEVVHMDDSAIPPPVESELAMMAAAAVEWADVVVVTDFGHGMMTPKIREIVARARFLAVNAQTNSANIGFNLITKYRKADYVCIDAPEARLAMADRDAPLEELVSRTLPAAIDCPRFVVTHGRNGCVAWCDGEDPVRAPAFTRTAIDTMGAGDAFFSVTAPLVAAGGAMEDIAFVGNAAGALKVNIVGHRKSIQKPDLIKYCQTILK